VGAVIGATFGAGFLATMVLLCQKSPDKRGPLYSTVGGSQMLF